MDKTVIFIVIVIICVLVTVWSACVMAARADEQLREITDDKKEPEEKEEDMTKQRTCKRCGMPTGATYYKININAECDRAGATTEQFCYNLSKTLTQANSPEDVYCRSCVDKIEKYINCDMAITERTYITDKPGGNNRVLKKIHCATSHRKENYEP